ncbi:MAG: hypothetical protein IPN76_23060 [Saprospiraceae bacterium]|nr:hypothetical protein [Saprospiraceae bacterium]
MTALQKLFALVFLAVALPFGARGQLGITTVASPSNVQPGDNVQVDFLVSNFENITSMQFTMEWPASQLEYQGTGNFELPFLSASNFGISQSGNGKLTLSWTTPILRCSIQIAAEFSHKLPGVRRVCLI